MSVTDIFSDPLYAELAQEYREDAGHADLCGAVDEVAYFRLEHAGAIKAAGLFSDEGDLCGFAVVAAVPSLHNSVTVAHADTLFVSKKHRKGAAGLRLIREAERMAEEFGAAGIRFSCPAGSRQEKLFRRLFRLADLSFYKPMNGDK